MRNCEDPPLPRLLPSNLHSNLRLYSTHRANESKLLASASSPIGSDIPSVRNRGAPKLTLSNFGKAGAFGEYFKAGERGWEIRHWSGLVSKFLNFSTCVTFWRFVVIRWGKRRICPMILTEWAKDRAQSANLSGQARFLAPRNRVAYLCVSIFVLFPNSAWFGPNQPLLQPFLPISSLCPNLLGHPKSGPFSIYDCCRPSKPSRWFPISFFPTFSTSHQNLRSTFSEIDLFVPQKSPSILRSRIWSPQFTLPTFWHFFAIRVCLVLLERAPTPTAAPSDPNVPLSHIEPTSLYYPSKLHPNLGYS